jgi:methyl-galactoside transport system permease protein
LLQPFDRAPGEESAVRERPEATDLGTAVRAWLADHITLSVLLALIVTVAVLKPSFLSITVLRDILMQCSTRTVVALGAALPVLTAGTDLSAGRQVGLAAVLSSSLLQAPDYVRPFYPGIPHLPLWLPIALSILVCMVCGLANGLIIARLRVAPFIATLGTMVAVHGLNSIYFNLPPNDSQPIGGLRADFTALGTGAVGTGVWAVPHIVLIALAVAAAMWVLLNKTIWGKYIYAVGASPAAAHIAGVRVHRTQATLYAIAGALYGLAGVLEAARTGGATNNYGNGYELDAVAACVVGGVSVAGGVGRVPGILAGVLVFGIMNYALTFLGLDPFWQLIVKGVIIVVAVAFDIGRHAARR